MSQRRSALRLQKNKISLQFVKYMAGGSVYFWVGYIVFAFCYSGLHWWWLWSKMLADVIGWSLNYFAQRYWAFAGTHRQMSEMKHVARYIIIESVGFVLDYVIIAALKYVGISPYIGFFISAGFFTVWSFYWYKYWVFPENHLATSAPL
jgi:putative flippase GtrA